MARIAIIGAGTAALPVAFEMAESARAEDRVSVISDRARFRAGPPVPWVAPRAASRGIVEFEIGPALAKKGIAFDAAGAKRVRPERNQVELGDGTSLEYDFLVIAAGPKPAFDEVEGLGPEGFTQSICHADHLGRCARAWNRLVARPGPLVVGAVQGATCLAPAYECAFRMDAELRRRGVRQRSPMTFVTPEPYVGELGVGGAEDSRARLEDELRARQIGWITGATVVRVQRARLHLVEGRGPSGFLPFRYALLMPALRGIDALRGIEGLVNERGFVLVDQYHRNPKYRNIFAAGVAIAAAPGEPASIPGARAVPCLLESTAESVARNIRDQIDGKRPACSATRRPMRLVDRGGSGLAFVADQGCTSAGDASRGAWVHVTQCACCDAAR
jgi:sulfide:quinone oxidoreductase